MSLEAIKWLNGKLQILDVLLLPLESKYINVENTEDGWSVINKMQVRGAPAIAVAGCLSLAAELASYDLKKYCTPKELHSVIEERLTFLQTARPTAVNMKHAAEDLVHYSKILLQTPALLLMEYRQKIIDWCVEMLHEDVKINKSISYFGSQAILKSIDINKKLIVLTHCNTGSLATAGHGTALGVVRDLHACKRIGKVFCTETRPYNQGARLTAYELVFEEIPAVLICDSMAAAMMKQEACDAVIVGADRVARNGDTANKIGTYQLAILAKFHGVTFYVCAPSTSIDLSLEDGSLIEIEERPAGEMTCVGGQRIAAPGIDCWNPAFDITPADLITGGIITEKGVAMPHTLKDLLASS